jgi:hypothetical protein
MSGPEHYVEAERLVAEVIDGDYAKGRYTATELLAAAQVHATLASAAAAALVGTATEDRAWAEVAAARFSPDGS